ncbi:MAG: hypothetical protein UR56_C0003G0062 [Candidatus Roizmanbacteria bacterium GW2011_GWC2_34_23]|uniref:Uncharacterized protein n=1 Tax=Candidatus Roizmanbacteria bacterium GW2011_GWC2_34_23 TaxID=1618484 RepID=A0A0G0DII8_9BACT|nr:MAG: hypothetical protein UR56_C0003G0062 [Candidatus Roizmanbacteria bacterium GW2011_GWC2_34_23]
MNKIKAIVLDVDGVIVGDKAGFNAPYPPTEVINKFCAVLNLIIQLKKLLTTLS